MNYTTDYEPWLFDRTATLFGVSARTGDVQWLRHAQGSAQFYDLDTNFWPERHQTYALMAALSAWEATGEAMYVDRAREIIDVSFDLAAGTTSDLSWLMADLE